MMLNQSLNLLLAEFVFTCRDLLGWQEEQASEMLIGLSETSSVPSRAMVGLAGQVRENPINKGGWIFVDNQRYRLP